MKRIILSIFLFCTCLGYTQNEPNPLVILDSKNIGYMDIAQNTLKLINPNDMLMYVYKGSGTEILQKFDSNSGVIIFATKKFILDTFYKNNIENSPLKKDIPSVDYLSKVGIIGSKGDNKYQPYYELIKYINYTTINEEVIKITSLIFVKPTDSKKIDSKWKYGALEITSPSAE